MTPTPGTKPKHPCPLSHHTSTSHTTTLPVSLPAAARSQSGLKHTDRIRPTSQVNVRESRPDAGS